MWDDASENTDEAVTGQSVEKSTKMSWALEHNRSREGHGESAGDAREFAEVEKVSGGQGEKEESGCQEMTLGVRPA